MEQTPYRTLLKAQKSDVIEIGYQSGMLLVGSCFSQAIGNRLSEHKFRATVNPFGNIFNPISIFQNLVLALHKHQTFEDELYFQQELWHHWLLHGVHSKLYRENLIIHVNELYAETQRKLAEASVLFITFGTAWAYRHKKTNQIVANCHKAPADMFEKVLLKPEEVIQAFDGLIEQLKQVNPDIQIVLTVSPVKHLRDGLMENVRSKAILLHTVHELCDRYEQVSYFPAYELVTEDLRDYRFYATDMAHPSAEAEAYVWDFFKKTYFNSATTQVVKEVNALLQAFQHRPIHQTQAGHVFKAKTIEKAKRMMQEYGLDFSQEIAQQTDF